MVVMLVLVVRGWGERGRQPFLALRCITEDVAEGHKIHRRPKILITELKYLMALAL